ncbi:MAG: helix-turn-helix domain-containing protein [Candidatus Obscuribacterales bacterium]|nr:helix-turn-helix domain-containing protein [Candidatus Obscuribacterales bacterium]
MEKSESLRELIATRIKEARKMAGLSQGQVASLMKMQRPSISEIEAGNRKVSAEELAQFASLFAVSASWLMGEGEDIVDLKNTQLQLAAREIQKLKGDDLDKLLRLLAAIPKNDAP